MIDVTVAEIKEILRLRKRINSMPLREIVLRNGEEIVFGLPKEPPGWTIEEWEMTGLTTLSVLEEIINAWEEQQK